MQKSGFPERQLWCAVVERALQDAIGPAAMSARDELRRPERQDALQWFLENGHDYQMACDAAGIDAEYLRHHVLALAGKNGEAHEGSRQKRLETDRQVAHAQGAE